MLTAITSKAIAKKAKGAPQQRLRISSGTSVFRTANTIHENREVPSWLFSSWYIENGIYKTAMLILIHW